MFWIFGKKGLLGYRLSTLPPIEEFINKLSQPLFTGAAAEGVCRVFARGGHVAGKPAGGRQRPYLDIS
jgi:hypothetical protein